MKSILNLLTFLFISICTAIAASPKEYGLYIRTYPYPKDEFTSVVLENGYPIRTFQKKLTLRFSIFTREENVFGSIFRIITNNNQNIDLLYSVDKNDKRYPILVTGKTVHPLSDENVKKGVWVNVSISIDPKTGDINLIYDKTSAFIKFPELKDTESVRIAFGYCPFENFSLADVASVNVKDITINRGKEEIRRWKLGHHDGNTCYDELFYKPATTYNPHWIIDQYITWNKLYSATFNSSLSIAFDPNIGTFYMATDKNNLYVYHLGEKKTDTISIKGGEIASNYPNQLVFIPDQNQLLSYNLDENIYSSLNPISHRWGNNIVSQKDHDYWNNTCVFNPEDSSLISFGGYGHYRYNNELLISYPFHTKPQQRYILKEIDPRYSCASVIVNDTLYVFGGRGCPSGRQELSPQNYYDLYAIDLKTYNVHRLWQHITPIEGGEFQPCEHMIYDKANNCFYVFCTQEGGVLIKINRDNPHFEKMSLPIGKKFDLQYLYTNIYFSRQLNKLYLVIHEAEVSGKSYVEIYELDYPPIPATSFIQTNNTQETSQTHNYWVTIIILLSLIAIAILSYIIYIKKRKHKVAPEYKASLNNNLDVNNIHEEIFSAKQYDFSKRCICFLGGFRIVDKEGNDITLLFTRTLKMLLIALILYTGKCEKGINGNKLIQMLWPGKPEDAAQNIRNVYMSKLRNILEKIGDIKIINQKGFWSIKLDTDVTCDYLEVLYLYNKNGNNNNIEQLLELLLHGMMLPNIETEWVDTFKSDFSSQTIDLLCNLLKQEDLSDPLKIRISDVLFQHDYLNENALSTKIRILCTQGKKGVAKSVYDAFCKEYYTTLGVEYQYSFMEIIKDTLEIR